MAVMIDEIQVDVQKSTAPAEAPASTEAPKQPRNLRLEQRMLAERELRLKAD